MSPSSSIKCVENVLQAYGTFSANHAPILRQDSHYLQMDGNKIPHDPCHLGVPSGASKMFSEPMVHFMQTMHLSCPDTNIVFKRTERRFHMTQVTKEFHWVHPKCFLSLLYIQRKPCTSLASRFALPPNGLKRAST